MRNLELIPADGLPEPPGVVQAPSIEAFPDGYRIGVTRYADVIFRDAFPDRFQQLVAVLTDFRIDVDEILRGGGIRSLIAERLNRALIELQRIAKWLAHAVYGRRRSAGTCALRSAAGR